MSERDSQRVVIGDATLYHGDCLDVMATLAPNSVDAIVTDPPYGLAFMGQRQGRLDLELPA